MKEVVLEEHPYLVGFKEGWLLGYKTAYIQALTHGTKYKSTYTPDDFIYSNGKKHGIDEGIDIGYEDGMIEYNVKNNIKSITPTLETSNLR